VKANFSTTDEALLITSAKSGLITELALSGLSGAAGAINRVGLVSGAGRRRADPGGRSWAAPWRRRSSGPASYYYQESDASLTRSAQRNSPCSASSRSGSAAADVFLL